MDGLDKTMEQRVWQRVLNQSAGKQEDLRGLILTAAEALAASRSLAGSLAGRPREQMKRILELQQRNLQALKGMQRLSGGQNRPVKVDVESPRNALETQYYRIRKLRTEYTARTADPEFGPIFQQLARREEEACCLLMEILGSR